MAVYELPLNACAGRRSGGTVVTATLATPAAMRTGGGGVDGGVSGVAARTTPVQEYLRRFPPYTVTPNLPLFFLPLFTL